MKWGEGVVGEGVHGIGWGYGKRTGEGGKRNERREWRFGPESKVDR